MYVLGYEDCRVGRMERKGQRGDECMHENWIQEQEKEEEVYEAGEVTFDSNRCRSNLQFT